MIKMIGRRLCEGRNEGLDAYDGEEWGQERNKDWWCDDKNKKKEKNEMKTRSAAGDNNNDENDDDDVDAA